MAIATVGSALGPVQDTNTTTTITYTLGMGETTTAGNLVILFVAAAGSTAAVANGGVDSKGNTYTVGPSVAPSGSVAGSILYGVQSLGLVAADTITVTLNHTSTDKQMVIREISGQDSAALDISVSQGLGGSGSNAPAVTSSPITYAADNEYVATMTVWNGSTTNTSDAGLTSVYAGHFDNGGAGQTKQMSVKEKIVTGAIPPSDDPPAYVSPNTTGWTHVPLGAAAPPYNYTTDTQTIHCSANTNYVLDAPARLHLGSITINPGTNSKIIVKGLYKSIGLTSGGADPLPGTSTTDQNSGALNVKINDAVGAVVYFEGCHIDGTAGPLSPVWGNCQVEQDGYRFSCPNVKVWFKNCRTERLLGGLDPPHRHADVMQTDGGCLEIHEEDCYSDSHYNNHYFRTENSPVGPPLFRYYVNRVEAGGFSTNPMQTPSGGTNTTPAGLTTTIRAISLGTQPSTADGGPGNNNSATNGLLATACWWKEFYGTLPSGKTAGQWVQPPDSGYVPARPTVNTVPNPDEVDWALFRSATYPPVGETTPSTATTIGTGDAKVYGVMKIGPPAQDFAPANMVGLNYSGTPFTTSSATPAGVAARTDSLGASQPWAVVLATFKASSAPPSSTAKGAARGMSTRSTEKPGTGYVTANSFSNRMFNIYWGSPVGHNDPTTQVNPLQATDGGVLDSGELARIDALIDDAIAHGDTVTFRLMAGKYSPAWMMAKVGTFQHADSNAGVTSSPSTVPKFWTQAYWDGWNDFISKLAARYDGGSSPTARQAAVVGCTAPLAMTVFGEPFQRHTAVTQNRAEFVGGGTGWNNTPIAAPGAGFSFALDNQSQRKAIDIHAANWSNTALHLTINPWQVLYSQTEAGKSYGSSGDNQTYFGADVPGLTNTKAIIDYAISVLGASNRLVLENNSPRDTYFNKTTGSVSQAASAGTIKVASTAPFPNAGQATLINATDPTIFSTFTYTGKTTTTFTGCSGGTGTYASGSFVYGIAGGGNGTMYQYFLTKPFARYFQCANSSNIGDFDVSMRGIVCCLLANACEPASMSQIGVYVPANIAFWDAALKGNSLPAGGTTAHVPTNTALPTIDLAVAGYTPGTVLTAHLGSWDPGTNALSSLHIQWYRKNPATNISTSVRGPTSKADTTLTDDYTLVSGDLNSTIYVTVTATNSDGTSSAIASQETPLIITPAAPAPTNTVLPVAMPPAPVSGDTITWDTGTWTGMPTSFTWDISRSNDGGATWNLKKSGTDPTWATTDTDIDWQFKADVTANNGQPSAAPATSVATSPVIGVPVITLTTTADTVPTDVSTYTFTGTVFPRGQSVTIAAFNVNGMAITVNPDGSFSQLVTVAPGVNTYTFTATDSAGDSTTENAQILRTVITTSADVDEIEVRIHQRGLSQ